MATKMVCDGCGREISKFSGSKMGTDGDGFRRSAQLEVGNNKVQWDLCISCLERAASALAEALPHLPRSEWHQVLGLRRSEE